MTSSVRSTLDGHVIHVFVLENVVRAYTGGAAPEIRVDVDGGSVNI